MQWGRSRKWPTKKMFSLQLTKKCTTDKAYCKGSRQKYKRSKVDGQNQKQSACVVHTRSKRKQTTNQQEQEKNKHI